MKHHYEIGRESMIELDRDWPRLHVVASTAPPHCATTPRRCGRGGRRRDFCESTGSGRFVSRRSMCCWNRAPTATSSLPSMRCCSVSSTGTTNGQCGATKVSMIAYFQAGAMARLDRVGRGVRAVGWTAADVADGQRTGVRIHCAAIGMPSSERSRMTDFTGVAAPLLRQYPGAA